MLRPKTRCKQCVHAEKIASQLPCFICSEIHYRTLKFQNRFLNASKNLMKEDKPNGLF